MLLKLANAEEFSTALKGAHLAIAPPTRPSGEPAVQWNESALPFVDAGYEPETASEVHGRGIQSGMSWMTQRDGPGLRTPCTTIAAVLLVLELPQNACQQVRYVLCEY